jgi:TolB-like protein
MAGEIFISYRRADRGWAELLHGQIKAQGVEAWYDAHVAAGEDWRLATAKALEDSTIFVLLFSENAARSSDIAKELAAAVLKRKLIIPVRLENIEPSGPFLYELASRNWVNAYENTSARLAELAKELAQLVKTGTRDANVLPFDHLDDGRNFAWRKRLRKPVAAALVVVAAAAVLLWLYRGSAPTPVRPTAARIAVLPFDTLSEGPRARQFADGLTDEIVTGLNSNRIQVVSRDDASTLRGSDRNRKLAELGVSLLFDGTVQDDGKAAKVSVHLDDPARHATLWSGSFDGTAVNSDQLQASIVSTIVAVLACSNRALVPAHGLTDPDLLTRYLHACDIFVNRLRSRQDAYEQLSSLRQVVAKAPDFAPAHSDLAKFAVYLSPYMPPDEAKSLRREAETEAHKALALDPKSPDAYLALAFLLPGSDWVGREKLLRQGVGADPNWPITNGFLGNMLAETGRLQEAVGYSQKAAAADLLLNWAQQNARLQCSIGQFEPATGEMLSALKRNPADVYAGYGLRGCFKYARRWADLRELAMAPSSSPENRTDPRSPIFDTYLVAETSRKPADVARARNVALSAPGGKPGAIAPAIENLFVLGFNDDAFALANQYKPAFAPGGGDTAFLFFTLTEPLRNDPRFMQLATRIGLVDYWRSSGHWPDFCAEPGLPYNCQAEANRIKPAK